jgi:DnaJ-class molecular chaperone
MLSVRPHGQSIRDTGCRAQRQPGRYPRAGSAAGQGNGAGDFDYDIFADLFRGRGGEGGTFRMPRQDLRYSLEIDFLDAVNGGHKLVTMPDGKRLDITIPPGINDGQVLRLRGQGMPGSDGKPGDAYVQISVRPDPVFKREMIS